MIEANGNGHTKADAIGESKDAGRASNRDRAQARAYEPASEKTDRRPSAEREHAFNALAWLVEGATGLLEELRHNDLGLPEDFWVHAYAARKEGLLAVRAVLDDLIARTESQGVQETEKQQRRERRGGINIDF